MTEAAKPEVSVVDAPDRHRYEANLDGSLVGFAEYHVDGPALVFTHTEVFDEAEGKGVGSALAKTALDEARSRGLRVVPQCHFIGHYISRHDDYLDLVDDQHRELVTRASS